MRLIAAGFLLVYPSISVFGQDSLYRFRPGVHLSDTNAPNAKQLRVLLDELRALTGFKGMQIKPNGDLVLGDRSLIEGGSEIARKLLAAAIDGKDSFALERRDGSATIAFAQIEPLLDYRDGTDVVRQDWSIRIDFADFKELRGDQAAIKSFGPGMNLLHELVHAILGYSDPVTANDPLGQCERHLNLIRDELGLPLRQHYFPNIRYAASPESIGKIFQGQIYFARASGSSQKSNEYSLTFKLNRVFDAGSIRPRSLVYSDHARLSRK